MARIIVTTDSTERRDPPVLLDDASLLLDESVCSVHLSTRQASTQFLERLAWAIADAEDLERPPRPERLRAERAIDALARPTHAHERRPLASA